MVTYSVTCDLCRVSVTSDKTMLMAIMQDVKRTAKDMRYFPTIIVQSPQLRYRPPQNPPGCLQIMQAINVTNDQVCMQYPHIDRRGDTSEYDGSMSLHPPWMQETGDGPLALLPCTRCLCMLRVMFDVLLAV